MTTHSRILSLDQPTVPALDPVETIALAHELGCDAVVLRMSNPPAYTRKPYNITTDAPLRRRIREEAAARGVFVALGAAFEVRAGVPVANLQPMLEAAADMGARGYSVVVYDTDRSTHIDSLSELAERSGKLGLRSLIEYLALSGINTLGYAVELIQQIGHPSLAISADALHFTRTGTTAAELAQVPAGLIAHGQLNDGPLHMPVDRQMDEARGERMLPGEGEFDLVGFIRALPGEIPIGVEAGSRSRFAAGVTMEEHGRAAVAAMRRVIAQALDS